MDITNSTLYVHDEEFENLAKKYEELSKLMSTRIDTYISILEKVSTDAVIEGYTHDNIETYYNNVCTIQGLLNSIMSKMQAYCTNYIQDIDDADSEYY